VLERLDRSLIVTGTEQFRPEEVGYLKGTMPGAILVRPDQLQLMTDFCAFLSTLGILRVAFLNLEAATEFVQVFAQK
jgi:hypothetical protein